MPLFRINQDELDTLVSVGGSVAFEFVNEKFLQKLGERRIIVGIQETADCLDGNIGKSCYLLHGKCLTKQGNNVECKPVCSAVVAGKKEQGFVERLGQVVQR